MNPSYQLFSEPLAKVTLFVTPVKTGAQKSMNSLDTGAPDFDSGFAGMAEEAI
jgi:hypothetical protein